MDWIPSAVASLQARRALRPLRSVTLAGCASGHGEKRNRRGLGETVAPKKWLGVGEAETPWPAASGREEKHHGRVRYVQAEGSTSGRLDQVPSVWRVRDF